MNKLTRSFAISVSLLAAQAPAQASILQECHGENEHANVSGRIDISTEGSGSIWLSDTNATNIPNERILDAFGKFNAEAAKQFIQGFCDTGIVPPSTDLAKDEPLRHYKRSTPDGTVSASFTNKINGGSTAQFNDRSSTHPLPKVSLTYWLSPETIDAYMNDRTLPQQLPKTDVAQP